MDRGEATCPQGCPRLPRLFTVSNVSFAQLNAGFYSRKQKFTLMNRSKARTWCCTRGGSGWGQAEGSLCPRPRQHTPPAGLSGGRPGKGARWCKLPAGGASQGRNADSPVQPFLRRDGKLQWGCLPRREGAGICSRPSCPASSQRPVRIASRERKTDQEKGDPADGDGERHPAPRRGRANYTAAFSVITVWLFEELLFKAAHRPPPRTRVLINT